MESVREVKKSFCVMSVAYVVLGLVLVIWPDISMKTFCYVFGVGMIIFGLAHLIIYFTKDKFQTIMQMDMVIGIVGVATGAYIMLKMEYMLQIVPFALGVVALLGAVVKLQNAIDLKRLGASRWYLMLLLALLLFGFGGALIANPFEGLEVIAMVVGISLIMDGVGNLIGIFWLGHAVKILKKAAQDVPEKMVDAADVTVMPSDAPADIPDVPAVQEQELPKPEQENRA